MVKTLPSNQGVQVWFLVGELGSGIPQVQKTKVQKKRSNIVTNSTCAYVSCWILSDSLQPRLLCPWNSPGKNTGVVCHSLLQRIFSTQGSNLSLPHCRQIPDQFPMNKFNKILKRPTEKKSSNKKEWCLSKDLRKEREPWRYLGEETSRQRKQQVQRPWGGNGYPVLEEQQASTVQMWLDLREKNREK